MANQPTPGGPLRRRVWPDKIALLLGGADVAGADYCRVSSDEHGQEHSDGTQRKTNAAKFVRHGWRHIATFSDNDRPATRQAAAAGRGKRPDYEALMVQIRAGHYDVLVMTAMTRSTRDLAVYVALRDLCTAEGLNFWYVGNNLYDLRDPDDKAALGRMAVDAEHGGDVIAQNSGAGVESAAAAGRPHGQVTYGYLRVYDERTRVFLRQVFDDELRPAVGVDGVTRYYSPAEVVRWVFLKFVGGMSISTIMRDLNARGIPGPKGLRPVADPDGRRRRGPTPPRAPSRWSRQTVRDMLRNPAYIGHRVFRVRGGDPLLHLVRNEDGSRLGRWEPLVTEEQFYAANNTLAASSTRSPDGPPAPPNVAKHLLSVIAECDCGAFLVAQPRHERYRPNAMYRCGNRQRGGKLADGTRLPDGGPCAAIREDDLDRVVELRLLGWVAKAENVAILYESVQRDPAQVSAAKATVERLTRELATWNVLNKHPDERQRPKPQAFIDRCNMLEDQIAEAEKDARVDELPPEVEALAAAGDMAADVWAGLNLAQRRNAVRYLFRIQVHPVGQGRRVPASDPRRVTITARMAPASG